MNGEIWKKYNEYPNYEFSNYGRIKNLITGNILRGSEDRDGYLRVDIRNKDNKVTHQRINRLIASTFYGHKDNLVVNHIDGNKQNNSIYNLEWISAETNSTLAAKDGLYRSTKIMINETGEIFDSVRLCADALGCGAPDIFHSIKKNKPYNGLTFTILEHNYKFNKESNDFLYPYQEEAVNKMKNGCILNGGTGTGKSRTGLYYYFTKNGGKIENKIITPMTNIIPLYIITTAMKRDKDEWETELNAYLLSSNKDFCEVPIYIDSWNNIKKYINIKNAFFIFDEDKVCGSGSWAKCFLKITKNNEWIILSASPGDRWLDYMTVFIANGFYKNMSEFKEQHVEYDHYRGYPLVKTYHNTGKLMRLRKKILVNMESDKKRIIHNIDIYCEYDKVAYKRLFKDRWNKKKQQPIQNASELCYEARRIVNDNDSRMKNVFDILGTKNDRVIIFYNFDYELDFLKGCFDKFSFPYAEWNGHVHQDIPDSIRWAYLVQYNAGAEGWNCTKTDTIIFYSQNYSYKTMIQASGRINRANTPFKELYYYHLKTRSPIDISISKALLEKKKFNESKFIDSLDLRFEN